MDLKSYPFLYLLVFWLNLHNSVSAKRSSRSRWRRSQDSVVTHYYTNSNPNEDQAESLTEVHYWCYHCASPRKNQKHEMLAAMDQLLTIRGSGYPYEAIVGDCHAPKNYSYLPRQYCRYPYCHKITFKGEEGAPLTIRGCSEKFIASNEREFCRKVHKELDITECSCKGNGTCSEDKGGAIGLAGFTVFQLFMIVSANVLLLT